MVIYGKNLVCKNKISLCKIHNHRLVGPVVQHIALGMGGLGFDYRAS